MNSPWKASTSTRNNARALDTEHDLWRPDEVTPGRYRGLRTTDRHPYRVGEVVRGDLRERRPMDPEGPQMIGRRAAVLLTALLLVGLVPAAAWAHGDIRLVDEVIDLEPGASASFDGELHYHRVVGQVTADVPVRVRLVAAHSGQEVFTVGPGTQLSFNHLVRCCDEAWAPHTLVIDNVSGIPVIVTARVSLVHDDLAVMVDGAESGTRVSIVLMGLGWWGLVWHAARRRRAAVPLRRPAIGLAMLSSFVLGLGTYAATRYGVGGPAAVVAGNADLPVIPMNTIVSRASLLMGLSMIGWATVGIWWVRARGLAAQFPWVALGVAQAGAAGVVAVTILATYGGPVVQTVWLVATVTPLIVVLASSCAARRTNPSQPVVGTPTSPAHWRKNPARRSGLSRGESRSATDD
jgi:hypothetical protein